jgi:GntR family transcriptional regulator/MocR family aminotransferase
LHFIVHLPPGLSEAAAVAHAASRGLALDRLDSYRMGAQLHAPALVVGYGTPPDYAFSAASTRLCATLAG